VRLASDKITPAPEQAQWMVDQYPADIRGWIVVWKRGYPCCST
jgi:hypothetical protein